MIIIDDWLDEITPEMWESWRKSTMKEDEVENLDAAKFPEFFSSQESAHDRERREKQEDLNVKFNTVAIVAGAFAAYGQVLKGTEGGTDSLIGDAAALSKKLRSLIEAL